MENILQIAMPEIGVEEVPGRKSNPRIIQYAKESGIPHYDSDATAWCSVFVNWVAYKAGLERTNRGNARSWLNVGLPVSRPEPGDIVVFWRDSRDSWKGHVAIFMGFSYDEKRVYCLGGNQGDQVSLTAKSIDKVLGYRRLRPKENDDWSRKNIKRGDTGAKVVRLQDALKQLGFDCGTSDGIFGPKTEQALREFQSTNGNLTINGIFDKATREYLNEVLHS